MFFLVKTKKSEKQGDLGERRKKGREEKRRVSGLGGKRKVI